MLECSQSQEVGIITANVDGLTAVHRTETPRDISQKQLDRMTNYQSRV